MKLERSRNTKVNIFYGSVSKVIMLLLPFLVQTVFLRTLGAEYLGLKGVFSSILQVLSLAELGFGSALVYSMYDAIARDDADEICGLLNLYKRIYRRIGAVILVAGMALMPVLKYWVKGDYPQGIHIYVLYMLYLGNSVLSYWMAAYKASLLYAYQRLDVVSVISTVSNGAANILQIIVLILFRNFYLYLALFVVSTILSNVLIKINVDRMFPEYRNRDGIPKISVKTVSTKVLGLLIYKICGITRNSLDSVFISAFSGLVLTAAYNNYFLIIGNVMGILSIFTASMLAGIGNSIATESIEKNHADFTKLDFIYMVPAGWCTVCILCLCQPFMKLWAGNGLTLPFGVAVLFVIYFYVLCMGNVRALYSDAAGLWWENRHWLLPESAANIILNYFLGKNWGIYGIVLATIITVFLFSYAGSATVLFRHYFTGGLWGYLKSHVTYAVITLANAVVTYRLCCLVEGNGMMVLAYRGLICCTISPIIFYACYAHTGIYKEALPWMMKRIGK